MPPPYFFSSSSEKSHFYGTSLLEYIPTICKGGNRTTAEVTRSPKSDYRSKLTDSLDPQYVRLS